MPSGENETKLSSVTTWNSPAVSCENGRVTMLIDQLIYLGPNAIAENVKTLKQLHVQFVLKLMTKQLTEQNKVLNVTLQTSNDVTAHVLSVPDANAMTTSMLSVFKEAAKSVQEAWNLEQGVFIGHASSQDSAAFVAVLWLILYQNFSASTAWNFVCLRHNERLGTDETLTGVTLDDEGHGIGAKLSWFQTAKACKPIETGN